MVAKRVLFPPKSPEAKRLRRMERQIYRNRPEMQTKTKSTAGNIAVGAIVNVDPCRMATGSGVGSRNGDKIRVYRIEIRGTTNTNLDHYIIQCKSNTQPQITDFGSNQGAYLLDSVNTNQYTEWAHYRPGGVVADTAAFKFSKRFKGGIVVKFNGSASTNIIDNEILYSVVNRSAFSQPVNVTCRIWYTDA